MAEHTQDEARRQEAQEPSSEVVIGRLELREELPVVTRERIQTGQVTFRRNVQTRTETLTTELRRETLVITVGSGEANIFIGGELLHAGDTREVLIYDEQVILSKQPYVTEEIHIGKQLVVERQEHQLELNYEVLVREDSPAVVDQTTEEQA